MRNEVHFNHNILTWAIARAGFDLNEFVAAFPNVKAWLEQKKQPTLKQLESFSHKLHVPFGYFFLENPPKETVPIPFFRSGKTPTRTVSLNVYETVQILERRQQWLREYLLDNDAEPLSVVGKLRQDERAEVIVTDMRNTLGLDTEWASHFPNYEDALSFITSKIESLGVVVVFNGVVENNNTRHIPVEECRGFVLVDDMVPFMFINGSDGKAAQLFTIIHELAHIWIGYSAGFNQDKLLPADDPIELLCDSVAAEFLVPAQVLIQMWKHTPNVGAVSKHFKVSRIVVARRALDLQLITRRQFNEFYSIYAQELHAKKQKQQDGGGNFYATQGKRLSPLFLSHVYEAIGRDQLLYRDAYKLTGLKANTFDKSIDHILFKSE